MQIKVNLDAEQIFSIAQQLLEKLTQDERKIIEVFYLNQSEKRHKIKKLQSEFNISKQAIYKIKNKILKNLKYF